MFPRKGHVCQTIMKRLSSSNLLDDQHFVFSVYDLNYFTGDILFEGPITSLCRKEEKKGTKKIYIHLSDAYGAQSHRHTLHHISRVEINFPKAGLIKNYFLSLLNHCCFDHFVHQINHGSGCNKLIRMR